MRWRGILQVLLSGVGFGLLGVFGKAAFHAGLSGGENLAIRFSASAALLWLYILLFRRKTLATLTAATAWKALALGVFGYAVFSTCYFTALRGLSAALTVLLLYTYPVLVALGGYVFLRHLPSPRTRRSLPVIAIGTALLVWGDIEASGGGFYIAAGLASAVLYAAYILVSSRVLRDVSPVLSVTLIQTGAGFVLALFHLRDPGRDLAIIQAAWPVLLAMTVFSTTAPMLLFLLGLQRLTPSEVSILSTVEPLAGVLIATYWLGESLAWPQLVGGAAVLGVIAYLATEKPPLESPL